MWFADTSTLENDDVFDASAARPRRELLVRFRDIEPRYIAALSDSCGAVADPHKGFLREFPRSSREMGGADEELLRFHHVDLPTVATRGFLELLATRREPPDRERTGRVLLDRVRFKRLYRTRGLTERP